MEYGFGRARKESFFASNLFGLPEDTLMPINAPHFQAQKGISRRGPNTGLTRSIGIAQTREAVGAAQVVPFRSTSRQVTTARPQSIEFKPGR